MDRDKRFDRVELAFDAIVNHKGESFECPVQYVKDSYAKETYDEFVIPGYNKNVDGQVADVIQLSLQTLDLTVRFN